MSFLSSNSQPGQLNFSIKTPVVPFNPTKEPFLTSGIADSYSQGTTSATISSGSLLGQTLLIHPSAGGQTYTLPTASSILNTFGRSIDTGIPRTSVGNMLVFNVVNRSQFPATLACNTTGGDGSAITCGTGSFGSTPLQWGKITPVYLEWLAVSGGLDGATGQYTIYA